MAGCSTTNDGKARKLIEQYLENHANDPKSIEIIEIGTLEADSASQFVPTAFDSISLKANYELLEDYKLMNDAFAVKYCNEQIEEEKEKLEQKRREFQPYFFWVTKIAYRGTNSFGALIRTEANVRFNEELTEIVSFEPIEE